MDLFRSPGIDTPATASRAAAYAPRGGFGSSSPRRYGWLRAAHPNADKPKPPTELPLATVDQEFEEYFFE